MRGEEAFVVVVAKVFVTGCLRHEISGPYKLERRHPEHYGEYHGLGEKVVEPPGRGFPNDGSNYMQRMPVAVGLGTGLIASSLFFIIVLRSSFCLI